MGEPITEYELLPPRGQWMRFSWPSRAGRLRRGAGLALAVLVSLALWTMMLVVGLRWLIG